MTDSDVCLIKKNIFIFVGNVSHNDFDTILSINKINKFKFEFNVQGKNCIQNSLMFTRCVYVKVNICSVRLFPTEKKLSVIVRITVM